MTIWEEAQAERRRQVDVEGYGAAHDARHDTGQLAFAAATYAVCAIDTRRRLSLMIGGFSHWIETGSASMRTVLWPFEPGFFKPHARRRSIAIAMALLAAQAERDEAADAARLAAKEPANATQAD